MRLTFILYFFLLRRSATLKQKRFFSSADNDLKEITGVTDVYCELNDKNYPGSFVVDKFTVHEKNNFHCNESYLWIKFFRLNETNSNYRHYYYGYLKQLGNDNRVLREQASSDYCQIIRRYFIQNHYI